MADKPPTLLAVDAQETLTAALSAAADGRASAEQLDLVMQAWATDADVRTQWAHFQLVAESLRNPAQPMLGGSSDSAFLSHLRTRMAQAPIVLAPAIWPEQANGAAVKTVPMSVARADNASRRMAWLGPAAMAACFVFLMSGLVTFIRTNDPTGLSAPAQMATADDVMAARTVASAETPDWPLETAWSTPAGFVPVATGRVRPEAAPSAYAITGAELNDSTVVMPVSLALPHP